MSHGIDSILTIYQNTLQDLDIKSLEERRIELCRKFAEQSAKSDKYKHWVEKADGPTVKTKSENNPSLINLFNVHNKFA